MQSLKNAAATARATTAASPCRHRRSTPRPKTPRSEHEQVTLAECEAVIQRGIDEGVVVPDVTNIDTPTPLDQLGREIRTTLATVRRCFAEGLEAARVVGALLTEAKAQVPHGQWEKWLTDEAALSPRKARRYMEFYRRALNLPHADLKCLQPIWDQVQGNSGRPESDVHVRFEDDVQGVGDGAGDQPVDTDQDDQSFGDYPEGDMDDQSVDAGQSDQVVDELTGEQVDRTGSCDSRPSDEHDAEFVGADAENDALPPDDEVSPYVIEEKAIKRLVREIESVTRDFSSLIEWTQSIQPGKDPLIRAVRKLNAIAPLFYAGLLGESSLHDTDADDREIPEHLIEIFETRIEFDCFARLLSELRGEVTRAIDANPTAWCQFSNNAFRAALTRARDQFTLGSPYIVCSYCGGSDSGSCKACKGTGFLSKAQARCVPKEMRPKRESSEE